MQRNQLDSTTYISFKDLLKICEINFGLPLIMGEHYIFETPWGNDPVISIQKDGINAKPYQIKIVQEALEKLKVTNDRH